MIDISTYFQVQGRGRIFNFLPLILFLSESVLPDIYSTFGIQTYHHWYKNHLELQDGRRVRCGDHLPPHKYIRNTSTCGTTPTEHLLNTGRRPQTSQKARNSPCTWVGQKKKEKPETKNRDRTCSSGRELWRRKGFHTLGSPFAGGDCGWRRGGALEPRRRAQPQGCGGQSGEIPAQRSGADWHSPAREACLLTRRGGRGLGAEARASVGSQGEDWGWRREHSLKGASVPQLAGRESRKKSAAA